jgi:hypothetical protein
MHDGGRTPVGGALPESPPPEAVELGVKHRRPQQSEKALEQ